MRAIYRTTFEIRPGPDSSDVFTEFSEHVWVWLYDRRQIGLKKRPVKHARTISIAPLEVEEGFRIETLYVEAEEHRGWSFQLQQNDARDPSLIWVSDLALCRESSGKYYFSFTQLLGRQDGGMMPIHRPPKRPRIIRTLVHGFVAAGGGLRLHSKPSALRMGAANLTQFIKILENPNRSHPVVLVSVHEQSKTYFIDHNDLADHLSGIAHVIVAENAKVSHALSGILLSSLTCFDGAIRVYWPGFRRDSQTGDHRLWTVTELAAKPIEFESSRFADAVLRTIAGVSVNSTSKHYCSLERLQSLDRRRVIALAKHNQDWEQLACAYAKDFDAKDLQTPNLKAELQDVNEQLFREQQRTEALKAGIEKQKSDRNSTIEEQTPIDSVAVAIERAGSEFSDKICFSFNQQSDDKSSPYRNPEEVWSAFEWLASDYFMARIKERSCADFDASIQEAISGWSYSGHQKESTTKANKDWYQCITPDGRKIWIPEHLRSGNSRDATEAIRIAFAWDETAQKVVVGFIGQHQRNTHTN